MCFHQYHIDCSEAAPEACASSANQVRTAMSACVEISDHAGMHSRDQLSHGQVALLALQPLGTGTTRSSEAVRCCWAVGKRQKGSIIACLRGVDLLPQVWMDSDGKVAYNGARVAGLSDPRGNPQEGPPSQGALLDHQWHMLTVSTQPNGVKGYR